MATNERLSENQDVIIDVLKGHNKSMTLLALKKESKLANLYFFQALNVLQEKKIVKVEKSSSTTIISVQE